LVTGNSLYLFGAEFLNFQQKHNFSSGLTILFYIGVVAPSPPPKKIHYWTEDGQYKSAYWALMANCVMVLFILVGSVAH
jgi:hypothetical protein